MRECFFTVNSDGRRLAALCHGEAGQIPVLAVHGWLDNAASFALLAPAMERCQLVAIDKAGHGHSDPRPADGEYNIWNDLPDLLAVADGLGWERFYLLGHSRGAIVSTLLASACPERVKGLVLLDGWSSPPFDPAQTCAQLGAWLSDRQRLPQREKRVFDSRESAIELRRKGGLDETAARLIAERNLRPCENGWHWSTDPRVQGASAFKLTQPNSAAIIAGLRMPGLLILAEEGLADAQLRKHHVGELPDMEIETVGGGHHFHMEEPVQELAERIQRFYVSVES